MAAAGMQTRISLYHFDAKAKKRLDIKDKISENSIILKHIKISARAFRTQQEQL